jgi:hypothetical protein
VEPFIVVLIIVAIIVLAVLGHQQAEKRKKALAAWAGSRGLSFEPSNDHGMDGRYSGFACLKKGDNRYAYNVMEGRAAERAVCAFDYHYETHSTDSDGHRTTHNHHFSAVIVEAGMPLKPLFIRTEHFFDKSPDRRWAFDVLQQSTMEFLLEAPRFALEFQHRQVIAYREKTFAPADFEAALEVIKGVLERLPEYLLREMKR